MQPILRHCKSAGAAKNINFAEQYRNHSALYNATLEAVAAGIILIDCYGNIISFNSRFLQLWRIPPELIEQKNDAEIIAFMLQQLVNPEEFIAANERIYRNPHEPLSDSVLFKDGRILERKAFPLIIDGDIVGRGCNFHDITEKVKTEKKNIQLIQKIKTINSQLEDFAYIVSHDLKAPLRGITTLANWIASDYADKFDQQGRAHLELLINRVDRMHNLIEGILQYSRAGRLKEEKSLVNLNELLPEIIDSIAPAENIKITIESTMPTINCEKIKISQVFQNLLSNAVKYMDKKQGWIKIINCEDKNFWKFAIADNGRGIDSKYFEKIFKLFQTLHTQDDFESSGVGLSLIKKIIELSGGKIWVQSAVGRGSTFWFTIPKQDI